MRVVLVEDDYLQAELIRQWLNDTWPQIEIERVETEAAFRNQIQVLSTRPPDVVIMDLLLRWSDPSHDFEQPPDEVKAEGFYRAGLRCVELLRKNGATKHIPIILYSVLEQSGIEDELAGLRPQVSFLPKSFEPAHLIRLVGSLIAAQRSTKQPSATTRDVFICHASEDKETVVDPLVRALEDFGNNRMAGQSRNSLGRQPHFQSRRRSPYFPLRSSCS